MLTRHPRPGASVYGLVVHRVSVLSMISSQCGDVRVCFNTDESCTVILNPCYKLLQIAFLTHTLGRHETTRSALAPGPAPCLGLGGRAADTPDSVKMKSLMFSCTMATASALMSVEWVDGIRMV